MLTEVPAPERMRTQHDLPPDVTRLLDERRMAAWVGRSVRVKGDVVCSEDLTIDGQVDGTIELGDHSLTIGVSARVTANLVARTVTIHGAVVGNVTARDKVDLRATGSVDGDVTTPRFAMADGAVLRGRVKAG